MNAAKSTKLLTLALDPAAQEGEWHNAVAALRRAGVTASDLLTCQPPRRQSLPVRMPFGKHKGKLLADIEDDYLEWLLTIANLKPALRRAVSQELEQREAMP